MYVSNNNAYLFYSNILLSYFDIIKLVAKYESKFSHQIFYC